MLPVLHAGRQLDTVTAVSAPHMTDRGRTDLFNGYRRQLDPVAARPAPVDAAALAAIGITVEEDTDG